MDEESFFDFHSAQHHSTTTVDLHNTNATRTTIIIGLSISTSLDVLVEIMLILINDRSENFFLHITCLHTMETLPSVATVGLSG